MTDQPRLDPKMLGQRVVSRRTELHLEQGDLAERANVSRSYISRLENGLVGNPKVFDLEQIAAALDMTLAELVQPDRSKLVAMRFSTEEGELLRQVEGLPDPVREMVLRAWRHSLEIAHGASDLARRN